MLSPENTRHTRQASLGHLYTSITILLLSEVIMMIDLSTKTINKLFNQQIKDLTKKTLSAGTWSM